MFIDPRVEGHVRECFRGVVARDIDRVASALSGLSTKDAGTALGLGIAVCSYVLMDAFPDGPTDDDIRETAGRIVAEESTWVELGDLHTVETFLTAAVAGDGSLGGLDREDIVILAFVCAGDLLATHYDDGTEWWDYLDEIWAAIEAAPDPAA